MWIPSNGLVFSGKLYELPDDRDLQDFQSKWKRVCFWLSAQINELVVEVPENNGPEQYLQ